MENLPQNNNQSNGLTGLAQQQANIEAINQLASRFDGLASETQRVILKLAERQEQTAASVEFLVDAVTRLTQGAGADGQRWRETQSEIQRLQSENRQILECLNGQGRNGNGGE